MKDTYGNFDLKIGDLAQSDKRPYPVIVLEILEHKGVFRFVDRDGVEDYGAPKPFKPKFKASTEGERVMGNYNNIDLMTRDDELCYDGNDIEYRNGDYVLVSYFDSGQDNVYADIKKLLDFIAKNEPELYMGNVTHEMMRNHT